MTVAGAGDDRDVLAAVLEESRGYGFLGPGPLEPHIEHARGFASTLERAPESFLDLGSGGGVPGLVLAGIWPQARGLLLDSMARRTAFLEDACARLGCADRVTVLCERAESAAHQPTLRARFDLVVARSFGPPAVTAECAAGFLVVGGRLVVSEPPTDDPGRWPPDGLEPLGLSLERGPLPQSRFAVLHKVHATDERFPRRSGVPAKRPLWT